MSETKSRFKMFKDILTQRGKYSQGRVYLLWSVIAYYITLGILTYAGIKNSEIDMKNFTMIVDALEYAMGLFGGYVFGGKFIDAYKAIKGNRDENKSEENNQ
jgi:hypothetical protein